MDVGSNVFVLSLFALVGMLVIFGLPAWWYWHGKKPGEQRDKRWGAIFLGSMLMISIGYVKPAAKGEWLIWAANLGRVVAGAWIIAFGIRGSPSSFRK